VSEHKNNEVVTMGLAQEVERLRNGQELLREQTVRIREALGNAGNGEDTEDAAKRLRAERDALRGRVKELERACEEKNRVIAEINSDWGGCKELQDAMNYEGKEPT